MTMTDVMRAGLPFVVEPVSPERVQSWASFAAQSSAKSAYSVVGAAFGAFWMEKAAVEEFEQAVQWLDRGGLQYVVMWLDGVVHSLQLALERWQRVIDEIERDPLLHSWAASWYADACARVQTLSRLQAQVVDWIVWCCAEAQWAVTSASGLEETQKYLASRR